MRDTRARTRLPSADGNDRSRPFFTPCARHAHRVGERIRCAPRDERIGDARLRMIADPRPPIESPLCRACGALLPRRVAVRAFEARQLAGLRGELDLNRLVLDDAQRIRIVAEVDVF
ncbi:hypothetical protein, partial [Burkholderia mallei]|uniref:hypothetical protein n=1 Tax=Burkholderia mallei TaxID=13373 RepID=UPI001EF1B82C